MKARGPGRWGGGRWAEQGRCRTSTSAPSKPQACDRAAGKIGKFLLDRLLLFFAETREVAAPETRLASLAVRYRVSTGGS